MKTKQVGLLMAAVMAVSMIAGCGGSKEASTATDTSNEAAADQQENASEDGKYTIAMITYSLAEEFGGCSDRSSGKSSRIRCESGVPGSGSRYAERYCNHGGFDYTGS